MSHYLTDMAGQYHGFRQVPVYRHDTERHTPVITRCDRDPTVCA